MENRLPTWERNQQTGLGRGRDLHLGMMVFTSPQRDLWDTGSEQKVPETDDGQGIHSL